MLPSSRTTGMYSRQYNLVQTLHMPGRDKSSSNQRIASSIWPSTSLTVASSIGLSLDDMGRPSSGDGMAALRAGGSPCLICTLHADCEPAPRPRLRAPPSSAWPHPSRLRGPATPTAGLTNSKLQNVTKEGLLKRRHDVSLAPLHPRR